MKNVYKVQKELYEILVSEKLSVGDRLPSERVLADKLQTTRTTLRKVFEHLEKKGVIHKRNQAGTFLALPLNEVQDVKITKGEKRSIKLHVAVMLMSKKGLFEDRLLWLHDQAAEKNHLIGTYLSGLDAQDPSLEKMYFQSLVSSNVKGLLVHATPHEPTNDHMLEDLAASGIRVVYYDWHTVNLPNLPFFLADYDAGGAMVVSELLRQGCREIVSIFGNPAAPSCRLMEMGMRRTCEELGVPYYGNVNPGPDMMSRQPFLKKVAAYSDDTGYAINSASMGDSLKAHLEEQGLAKKAGKIVAVDEYDPEDGIEHKVALVGFSWRERVRMALGHVMSDSEEIVRVLQKPRFFRPRNK